MSKFPRPRSALPCGNTACAAAASAAGNSAYHRRKRLQTGLHLRERHRGKVVQNVTDGPRRLFQAFQNGVPLALQRVVSRIDGVLLRLDLLDRRFISHLFLIISQRLFRVRQRFLRTLDALTVRAPFPLPRSGVVIAHVPFVSGFLQRGAGLFHGKLFFLQRQPVLLYVAGFLQRVKLLVQRVDFGVTHRSRLFKLCVHSRLQLVNDLLLDVPDLLFNVPPFRRKGVDLGLLRTDAPQIFRLVMQGALNVFQLVDAVFAGSALLLHEVKFAFQQSDGLFVSVQHSVCLGLRGGTSAASARASAASASKVFQPFIPCFFKLIQRVQSVLHGLDLCTAGIDDVFRNSGPRRPCVCSGDLRFCLIQRKHGFQQSAYAHRFCIKAVCFQQRSVDDLIRPGRHKRFVVGVFRHRIGGQNIPVLRQRKILDQLGIFFVQRRQRRHRQPPVFVAFLLRLDKRIVSGTERRDPIQQRRHLFRLFGHGFGEGLLRRIQLFQNVGNRLIRRDRLLLPFVQFPSLLGVSHQIVVIGGVFIRKLGQRVLVLSLGDKPALIFLGQRIKPVAQIVHDNGPTLSQARFPISVRSVRAGRINAVCPALRDFFLHKGAEISVLRLFQNGFLLFALLLQHTEAAFFRIREFVRVVDKCLIFAVLAEHSFVFFVQLGNFRSGVFRGISGFVKILVKRIDRRDSRGNPGQFYNGVFDNGELPCQRQNPRVLVFAFCRSKAFPDQDDRTVHRAKRKHRSAEVSVQHVNRFRKEVQSALDRVRADYVVQELDPRILQDFAFPRPTVQRVLNFLVRTADRAAIILQHTLVHIPVLDQCQKLGSTQFAADVGNHAHKLLLGQKSFLHGLCQAADGLHGVDDLARRLCRSHGLRRIGFQHVAQTGYLAHRPRRSVLHLGRRVADDIQRESAERTCRLRSRSLRHSGDRTDCRRQFVNADPRLLRNGGDDSQAGCDFFNGGCVSVINFVGTIKHLLQFLNVALVLICRVHRQKELICHFRRGVAHQLRLDSQFRQLACPLFITGAGKCRHVCQISVCRHAVSLCGLISLRLDLRHLVFGEARDFAHGHQLIVHSLHGVQGVVDRPGDVVDAAVNGAPCDTVCDLRPDLTCLLPERNGCLLCRFGRFCNLVNIAGVCTDFDFFALQAPYIFYQFIKRFSVNLYFKCYDFPCLTPLSRFIALHGKPGSKCSFKVAAF